MFEGSKARLLGEKIASLAWDFCCTIEIQVLSLALSRRAWKSVCSRTASDEEELGMHKV